MTPYSVCTCGLSLAAHRGATRLPEACGRFVLAPIKVTFPLCPVPALGHVIGHSVVHPFRREQ